jgi:hypothetical protein
MREWIHLTGVKLAHKGEHFFHLTYLGMVGWEGDHLYRYAAIALFVFVTLNAVIGEHE